MTVLEIRDKVRKAEEAVEKIRNTIRRNESFAARKLQVIREYGWDENDPYCRKEISMTAIGQSVSIGKSLRLWRPGKRS